MEYRTNLKHAHHCGFQNLDVEHRTDSRRPMDQPPGTTTETEEGGGRRRQPKTDSLRTCVIEAPLKLTTPKNVHWTWYFSSHATRWLPSPWQLWQSPQPQVQSRNHPISLVPELAFRGKKKTVGLWSVYSPPGLCKLVWQKTNYKTLGTTAETGRRLLFFVPDSPLCPKHVIFLVPRRRSTYLND